MYLLRRPNDGGLQENPAPILILDSGRRLFNGSSGLVGDEFVMPSKAHLVQARAS